MSVLAANRTTSRAEFINTANEIYVTTIRFLTRLSARYSRLIAQPIADLAGDILDNCEMANSIYPRGEQQITKRRDYLLEARAKLRALDVRLTHAYQIMGENPQGCFQKGMPPGRAARRLDSVAITLSELIDHENSLLIGALKLLDKTS